MSRDAFQIRHALPRQPRTHMDLDQTVSVSHISPCPRSSPERAEAIRVAVANGQHAFDEFFDAKL